MQATLIKLYSFLRYKAFLPQFSGVKNFTDCSFDFPYYILCRAPIFVLTRKEQLQPNCCSIISLCCENRYVYYPQNIDKCARLAAGAAIYMMNAIMENVVTNGIAVIRYCEPALKITPHFLC